MYLGERDINRRLSRGEGYKPSCISKSGKKTVVHLGERALSVVYLGERDINRRVSRLVGNKPSCISERGI